MRVILSILGAGVSLVVASFTFWRPQEMRWLWHEITSRPTAQTPAFREALPPCVDCNVILISLDTLRADRLAVMPNLQAIAEKSLVFKNAYANGYYTTPSHMTVFTSLYPARHRVETKILADRSAARESEEFYMDTTEPLSKGYITWAELMREHGYATFWHGPLKLRYLKLELGFGRGFDHFQESAFARGLEFDHFPAKGFNRKAVQPLSEGKKAFVFLHSYIAHSPFFAHSNIERYLRSAIPYNENLLEYFADRIREMPEVLFLQNHKALPSQNEREAGLSACTRFHDMRECFSQHSSRDSFWHAAGQMQHRMARREIVARPTGFSDEELKLYREAYSQSAQELDRQIGEFWDELERTGVLDRTLVLFFSDHGEALFERGNVGHGAFFEEVARIPIILFHPKLKQKVEVPQITSLVDLMPAVLDLLAIPPPAQMQGRVPWKNPGLYAFGSSLGSDFITDGRWKLITDNLRTTYLFDLYFDPEETRNLVDAWLPGLRRERQRLEEAREKAAMEIAL